SRKPQSIARPSFASACSVSTIWSSRALKRSFCPLSHRSLGRIESHPPPSRRRDRITTNRPDQFARNQAHRHPFLANARTRRSTGAPQKSGESGFFTDDGIAFTCAGAARAPAAEG